MNGRWKDFARDQGDEGKHKLGWQGSSSWRLAVCGL